MRMLKVLTNNPLLDGYIRREMTSTGYGFKPTDQVGNKWRIETSYGWVYLDPEFVKVHDSEDFPFSLFDDPKEVQWQLDELRKNKSFAMRWNGYDFEMGLTLEPITLEDKYLGSLRLRLHQYWIPSIDRLTVSGNIDLLPRAVSCHPHVSANNRLCYGDSSVGALAALRDGRFYDYFMLVESILKAYDPGSAYWYLSAEEAEVSEDEDYVEDDHYNDDEDPSDYEDDEEEAL